MVSEYKNQMPMWWKLKCLHELKNIILYLKTKFEEMNVAPIPTNLLLITLENECSTFSLSQNSPCPKYELPTQEDVNFLNSYFSLAITDAKIKVFTNSNKKMLEDLDRYNLLNLKSGKDNLMVAGIKWLYKNAEAKDMLLLMLFFKFLNTYTLFDKNFAKEMICKISKIKKNNEQQTSPRQDHLYKNRRKSCHAHSDLEQKYRA